MQLGRSLWSIPVLLSVCVALVAAPAASAPAAAERQVRPDMREAAERAASRPAGQVGRVRRAVPEDRYAMAGGCYTVRDAGGGYLARAGSGFTALADHHGAAPIRFQATDLGGYLLYLDGREFVAASEGAAGEVLEEVTGSAAGAAVGGLTRERTDAAARQVATGPAGTATGRGAAVEAALDASELADWVAEETGDGRFTFTLPALDQALVVAEDGHLALGDTPTPFALDLADGCAVFPEIDVQVDGHVVGGERPHGEVRGFLDAHLHMMAFEFLGGRARCGRPWHRWGVEHALKGCAEHELLGGRGAVLETFLSGRDPVAGHDTNSGWPEFRDWPKYNSLTYEQLYYKWLERAWRGGLRMFVNLLVDNNKLCEVYPYKRNSCNEMDGVRLQAQRLGELQDYIDAQHGGPGRGWFRIVRDPFEARRVMNEGRLAVVLGIEVSVPFDCGVFLDVPRCDLEQIDAAIDEVYDLGVRQMEIVNKFDNALTGVAGDAGSTGVLVNGGNFLETGAFWRMETCEDAHDHAHDRRQYNLHDEAGTPDELTGRDALVGIILNEVGRSGRAPAYSEGPHCNAMGLTDLGAHVIRRMVEKGMVFDPDHMSAKARSQALDLIEAEGHPGVISSHGWADETIYPRILAQGGVVTPYAGSSTSFVRQWRQHLEWVDDRYFFGFGFGADTNGFGTQGAPRGGDVDNPVTYPFTGFGGVTVHQQVSGTRTFDVNTDGVAHYGLIPDWIEDLRKLAGDGIVADLERGPEAYLQMWERSIGLAPDACRPDVDDVPTAALGTVRPDMTPEQVLLALGQPRQRSGEAFGYCVTGGTATVAFDAGGMVSGVDVEQAAPAPALEGPPSAGTAADATAHATVDAAGTAHAPAAHAHDHAAALQHHPASASFSAEAFGWLGLLFAGAVLLLARTPLVPCGRRLRGTGGSPG